MSKEHVEQLLGTVAELRKSADEEQKRGDSAEGQAKIDAIFEEVKNLQAQVHEIEKEAKDSKMEYEVKDEAPLLELKRAYSDPRAKGEKVERLRELGDAIKFSRILNAARGAKGLDPVPTDKMVREFKTLTTAGSGSGAEWIPTDWSPDLIDVFEIPLPELQVFPRFDMPSDPFKFPQKSAHGSGYVIGENTSITASDVTTASVTFESVKFAARNIYSYEMDEDSLIAILPMIRDDLQWVIADSVCDAIQNGDADGTHMDTDTEALAATVPAKHFDGLRKYGLNATSCKLDMSSTETAAGVLALRKLMGKYGVQPGRLALFTSPAIYFKMLGFDEVETVEKYGAAATIQAGELGRIYGMPIYVSDNVRTGLNASGVDDATTATEGCIIITMPSAWRIGVRRDPMIEVDKTISTQSMEVVASARYEFEEIYAANEAHTVIGYNFTF